MDRSTLRTAFRVAGLALVCACLMASRPARASETHFLVNLDLHGLWFPNYPGQLLVNGDLSATGRMFQSSTLASGGSGVLIGAGLMGTITVHDRWLFPMTGLQFALATTNSPAVLTSLDGSLAETQPWTAGYFSLLLPGFGVRYRDLHLLVQARLYTGVSFLWMQAEVQSGNTQVNTAPYAASFLVRFDLEACYRLDPTTSYCLFVAPNLYEFGALNGGIAGIRAEFGP